MVKRVNDSKTITNIQEPELGIFLLNEIFTNFIIIETHSHKNQEENPENNILKKFAISTEI